MELKGIRERSKRMLASFIDEIGSDGDYYVEVGCKAPIAYIDDLGDNEGEYITPKSKRYYEALPKINLDELEGKDTENIGFIVINDKYKYEEVNFETYITVMHEMIHSNRNLLIHEAYEYNGREAVIFNNGKYEQTSSELTDGFGDASQNILKGKIDNSRKTVEKHNNSLFDSISRVASSGSEVKNQLEKQKIVDEALVDVMAYLAYKRNLQKQRNENEDIWDTIEAFKNNFYDEYEETKDQKYMQKSVMCEIILRHHDFELFNWMLDPISYSAGDIHYDFFGDYTKNDGDLLEKLYCEEKEKNVLNDFLQSLRSSVNEVEDMPNESLESENDVQINSKSNDDINMEKL